MLDSGATYHLATHFEDFDKGSLEYCNISLRLGNDNKMNIQWKGKCTRQTNTKTTIVMRDVLYAPECPTRIIATGKLTKEGKGVYIQEQKEVRLELCRTII